LIFELVLKLEMKEGRKGRRKEGREGGRKKREGGREKRFHTKPVGYSYGTQPLISL
jgi:hypothetical protein